MREFISTYRLHFSSRDFRAALFFSLSLLLASIVVSFFAVTYATERASGHLSDVILSSIPVFEVGGLFIYCTIFIILFVTALGLMKPHRVPFMAASLALFYFVRALFISVTHLGPFPGRIDVVDWGVLVERLVGGADHFFSGHTGAPFLLALLFWEVPLLRYFFLAWSLFFAAIVLLGHFHYTVDVLSAYFITYAIFHISEYLFPKYRQLFHRGLAAL